MKLDLHPFQTACLNIIRLASTDISLLKSEQRFQQVQYV